MQDTIWLERTGLVIGILGSLFMAPDLLGERVLHYVARFFEAIAGAAVEAIGKSAEVVARVLGRFWWVILLLFYIIVVNLAETLVPGIRDLGLFERAFFLTVLLELGFLALLLVALAVGVIVMLLLSALVSFLGTEQPVRRAMLGIGALGLVSAFALQFIATFS